MPQTTWRSNVQDHWIDVGHGRLYARAWHPREPRGGAPIVLLHESLGCVDLWRAFPDELAARTGRSVIAYDRLGFGRSDAYPGRLPLDFIEQEADTGFAAVRQQLDIGRFILFGHSVGGGMAVNVAARCPDTCAAVVTESAQAFVEDRTLRGIEDIRERFKNPAQLTRLRSYHGDKAEWVLDAWIGSWLHPGFASWSLRPVLPEVACPILAMHGADDEYGTLRHPQIMAELAAGPVRIAALPGTRHQPHREKTAEVLELAAEFLDAMA